MYFSTLHPGRRHTYYNALGSTRNSTWTKSSGVKLNPNLISFLDELAQKTPVPIHVTSGVRSAEDQVRAVCGKVAGGDNLSIYSTTYAAKFLEHCPDSNVLVPYQQAIFLQKKGSKHFYGTALDLRNRNLSQAQQTELIEAIRSLGGTVLVERIPPHIHVEVDTYKTTTLPFYKHWTFWVTLGVVFIPLGIIGWKRHHN